MLQNTINDLIYNLPTNDELTWDTICRGDVKGIFQLEYLGKHWSKELKPRSIEELSDLISVIRPGTLESKLTDENGKVKSLTQVYCDRKNKIDIIKFQHPDLEVILGPTQGIIVYQEQAMRLAQILAGFDLIQADILRKAIGTKDSKIMASLEKTFLDGCKTIGKLDEQLSKEVFENIKNSQRYSFNQCLSPDTVVESRHGYLTLDEVNIGDEILTPSSDYKTNVFSTVLNKIEQGKQEVYEVILESGDSILCTLNHKFLCSDKIIRRLSDIIKNNHEMTLLDENNV
jgi:hypothetical protein